MLQNKRPVHSPRKHSSLVWILKKNSLFEDSISIKKILWSKENGSFMTGKEQRSRKYCFEMFAHCSIRIFTSFSKIIYIFHAIFKGIQLDGGRQTSSGNLLWCPRPCPRSQICQKAIFQFSCAEQRLAMFFLLLSARQSTSSSSLFFLNIFFFERKARKRLLQALSAPSVSVHFFLKKSVWSRALTVKRHFFVKLPLFCFAILILSLAVII